MDILISGSNGFLGRTLYTHLSKDNTIWRLSRSKSDFNCSLEKTIPEFNIRFDIVIHAAGKAHVEARSQKLINDFYNVNVLGTKNLLTGLQKSKIPQSFIFISSVSVYGRDFGNLINENTPLEATDPYGMSKIQAEELVLSWCKQNDVTCSILRLPLIVGQGPPGNLGAMIKGIQNGIYFNIAGGRTRKSMVLSEDVANYILKVAYIGGIFNLTDGCHPSFLELSEKISADLGKGHTRVLPFWFACLIAKFGDLLGSKAPLNTKKLKKITSNLTFDESKAREAFGWNPTPVLEGFKISENIK
jgi:nucleoside-diphosphate-sugar epimerase